MMQLAPRYRTTNILKDLSASAQWNIEAASYAWYYIIELEINDQQLYGYAYGPVS